MPSSVDQVRVFVLQKGSPALFVVSPHHPEALHLFRGGLHVTEIKQECAYFDGVIWLSLDVYYISSFSPQFF